MTVKFFKEDFKFYIFVLIINLTYQLDYNKFNLIYKYKHKRLLLNDRSCLLFLIESHPYNLNFKMFCLILEAYSSKTSC